MSEVTDSQVKILMNLIATFKDDLANKRFDDGKEVLKAINSQFKALNDTPMSIKELKGDKHES